LSISKQLNTAIISSMLGKYGLYIFQLVSVAILARLFTPEDFGIVAAAQVFAMFFQMLATSGLAPAIVYQENVSGKMRDGVFSFSCILGIFLAMLFFISAPSLHAWFGFGDGLIVFYTLAPCVLFASISMLPLASLQKDAKFLVIARAEIIAELVSFVACIVASYYWSGIFALALKFLLVPVLRFFAYYIFSANTVIGRASLGKELNQVVTLYQFAKYQVAFNILNFFARNLDNILIAKYFGASALGVYEKTYQVMRYPLQLFTFAITPALQPVLTKFKHDPSIVFKAYIDVAYKLAFVGLFSATVIYWRAADIVYILFGEQWFGAVPYLKILALSIPVQMVLSSTGGVYQAFGATKSMFVCGVFGSAITVSAILLGVYQNDLIIICMALVIAFCINFLQCFYMLYRTIFVGESVKLLVGLVSLIGLGFVNVIFDTNNKPESLEYIHSISSIVTTSLLTSLILVLLFFTVKKIKN
jgi:O-antigen/teichoic acid export membrane protein